MINLITLGVSMKNALALLTFILFTGFSILALACGGGHGGAHGGHNGSHGDHSGGTVVPPGGDGHEHTGQFCSAKAQELCLHLGIPQQLNPSSEGKFMVHFTVAPELAAKITLTSVVLWMPSMGHGSAPTKLEKISDGKFVVTNAWFVMPGSWSIMINYSIDGTADQIIVPIEI
jgi:hypothetical protein